MNDAELNNLVSIQFPGNRPLARPRPTPISKPSLVAMLRKLAALQMETLTRYVAFSAVEPFHASTAIWRMIIGGNRTSKTTGGLIEVARAFCNCDPYNKYKSCNGKILVIGWDEKHLADPIARKLFQPGAFQLIKDEQTKLPRFLRVNPNDPTQLDPYDAAYEEKWFPSPPIIPPRMIRGEIAWLNKGIGAPASVTGVTGWHIEFRSGKSHPKIGDEIDLGHIDESIENGQHYLEMARGMIVPKGRGIWTATPQNVSIHLWELYDRHKHGDPNVFATTLSIYDNFTIAPQRREEWITTITSPEERATRIFGIFSLLGRQIYPLYDPQIAHGCEPGDVPEDVTRYVFLDPGRQHCATCLVAVDREEKHRYIYDAFEIRNLINADQWANEIKQRQKEYKFEAFVIDGQAGQSHSMAGGPSMAEQYWDALVAANVQPRTMGMGGRHLAGFFCGLADVAAREEALCNWMAIRGNGPFAGTPILKVVRGCCPELDRQIRYARTSGSITDKREKKEPQDLVEAAEYAAAFNPGYHEPEPVKEDPADAVYKSFIEFRRSQQRSQHRSNRYQLV